VCLEWPKSQMANLRSAWRKELFSVFQGRILGAQAPAREQVVNPTLVSSPVHSWIAELPPFDKRACAD
jgi:hypothetical protein